MRIYRIISIIPYKILPAKLGGEKGIAKFNEYLGKLVPLTAIATKNNDPAEAKNYEVLNILENSRKRYTDLSLVSRIKKVLKDKQATHLIIEHPYFGWLAWQLKKSMPLKWIVHSHNIEFMRSKSIGRWWWKFLKTYEAWVYRKADIVFFISDADRHFAIDQLRIDPRKSYTITYGVEFDSTPKDILSTRKKIAEQYNISENEKIILFNGALYHHTNYDALTAILEKINPVLLNSGLKYKIIVCGKGLPDSFRELNDYRNKNIIYAGFVEDINPYFKAADIFLNPIISGGGVKTKAIEALAMNCTVISTEIGALGLKRDVCGDKLIVVNDRDWMAFTKSLIAVVDNTDDIPPQFFEYYYWGNIAKKAASIIKNS